MITHTELVKSSSGASVKLRHNTDCTNENAVYLIISCNSHNKEYVGEKRDPLNKRINGCRDHCRHCMVEISPKAEYFHFENGDFISHAYVCCIEHNAKSPDFTRKAREGYWIRQLNPLAPFGINKDDLLENNSECCVVVYIRLHRRLDTFQSFALDFFS